jgi:hypothetical protein
MMRLTRLTGCLAMAIKSARSISIGLAGVAILIQPLPTLGAEKVNSQIVEIDVDDPRPVAAAVDQLVARFGYAITYEDPRYAFSDDLKDVTAEVGRDLARKYPKNDAPRILVPAGGQLRISVNAPLTLGI